MFWGLSIGYQVRHIQPLTKLDGQEDVLTGWVEVCPASGSLYTLHVTAAEKVPANTRVLLYCNDRCAPKLYETVSSSVQFSLSAASYRANGIVLVAFPTAYDEEAVLNTGERIRRPITHYLQPLRDYFAQVLRRYLPGDEGALLAALCLGQKHGLPTEIEEAFRGSGLAHLLVVSGLHLSLVAVSVRSLLRRCRLGMRAATIVSMILVLVFMCLIGFTPSIVRAGVMCLIWLAGQLLRRRADGLNSLGLAAMLLLAYNPYMAVSVSFQLSFAATAGVICLASRLSKPLLRQPPEKGHRIAERLCHWYNTGVVGLAACLGASLFTLPLVCRYFGGFPLTTPLSNLLAVIPGSWALLSGWVGLLLCSVPGLAFLGRGVLTGAGYLARYLMGVADLCDSDAAFIRTTSTWQHWLVAGICLTIAVGILLGEKQLLRRILVWGIALLVLAWGTNAALTRHTTTLTVQSVGSGTAVYMEQPGYAALLVTHSDGLKDATYLLEDMGCVRLDALLIGTGEPAHVGQLAQLLRQMDIRQVFTVSAPTWAVGLSTLPTPLSPGSALTGGRDVSLLVEDETRWHLHCGETDLLLCVDLPFLPPGTQADGIVYSGRLPAGADTAICDQGLLMCSQEKLPVALPESYPILVRTEDGVTLTTRGTGEWSIIPWL